MPLILPNTIENGQQGDAAPVQENFEEIRDFINTETIQRDGSVAFTPTGLAAILPPGIMLDYGGSAAPSGWLLCDGAAVSRTTYASLFTAIGTAYGAGDGSTTFNVPNGKGRVFVGRDAAQTHVDTLGETGGSKDAIVVSHTHTQPTHTHTINHNHAQATSSSAGAHTHDPNSSVVFTGSGGATHALDSGLDKGANNVNATSSDGAHTHTVDLPSFSGSSGSGGGDTTGSTGSSGTNANMPPYQVVNKIIKT